MSTQHEKTETKRAYSPASTPTSDNSHSGGQAIAPPPFQMKTANPIQKAGVSDWVDWGMDRIGDALDMRDNEATLDAKEDKEKLEQEKLLFKSQNYGPITYTRPNISGSGFEASYFPNANLLNAEVRAKVRFADGLVNNSGTISSPNHFMNQTQLITILNLFPALQTQVLPYYQWGNDEREIHLVRFKDNIKATMGVWQNTGMSFQVKDTGWEDVIARPNIDIKVAEGNAVHKTENYGPFGILSRTDEAGSDHLQIEIVKKISTADAATVNTIITNFIQANVPSLFQSAFTPPTSDARGVRSYLGNDGGARNSASAGHNNFMSLESDRSDDPEMQTHRHSVYFDNNSADLNPSSQTSLDGFLSNPSVLLQNPNGAVNVSLKGFASSPGTADYNTSLVDQRLATVSQEINNKMDSSSLNIKTHVDPLTQHNDSDTSAEAVKSTLGTDVLDHAFRRVDIEVVQSGRGGQNVLAHEFGHVFGLGDQYVEVGSGYNRPSTASDPTSLADHDQLAKDAGVATGAPVANDSRMMSTGNDVQAEHYSTFADALKQLTGKQWIIKP